jgi:hypothetical protein
MVSKRCANKKTVQKTLCNWRWIGDIQGVATMGMLNEFLKLGHGFRHHPATRRVRYTCLAHLLAQGSTLPNLHMTPFAIDPSDLIHGGEF